MNEQRQDQIAYWQKVVGGKDLKISLEEVKEATIESFKNESDNYKQQLVYKLLEVVKNNDQNKFFYLLLRTINKPKEDLKKLWNMLNKSYDIMPEEAFTNFAYSIIIGIMSSYKGTESKKEGEENEQ
ncbi:MAG: hypothetical protein QW813_02485 [Candidatus Aenigmatarchaeota archaeon]